MNQARKALVAICCLASGVTSAAVEVTTNGFLTAGTTMIDEPDATFNSFIKDRVGFEYDSRMGLRFSAKINPQLEFAAQLLSRARLEGWDVKADWAFASYKLNDHVSVRAGSVRIPLYLASEYVEVGYAYPWVRPPAEVYRLTPVNATTGVSVPLKANLGGMDLLVQPMAGSLGTTIQSRGLEIDIVAENMVGGSIDLSNDILRLHAAYLSAKVFADTQASVPLFVAPSLGPVTGDLGITLLDSSNYQAWDVGMSVDWKNILLMTEYTHTHSWVPLDDQFGWYATLGYKMGNFLPYVTYAERRSDDIVNDPSTFANEAFLLASFAQDQNSMTLGLRYNIGNASALKFEVQQASTQGDTCGFIDGAGPGVCSGDFPLNGSYNMYSVAYDVVF